MTMFNLFDFTGIPIFQNHSEALKLQYKLDFAVHSRYKLDKLYVPTFYLVTLVSVMMIVVGFSMEFRA